MLRVTSLLGFLVCGGLFYATYPWEEGFVRGAKGYLEDRVTAELSLRFHVGVPAGGLSESVRKLQSLLKQHVPEARKRWEELAAILRPIVDRMVKPNTEQRRRLHRELDTAGQRAEESLMAESARLEQLIERRVLVLIDRLLRDVRIFLGLNAALFGALLLVSSIAPASSRRLLVLGLLLVAAIAVASAFHAFGRDWFLAMLTNNLAGFGYLGGVGVAFAFLIDIAMNRGRGTQVVIEILDAGIATLTAVL